MMWPYLSAIVSFGLLAAHFLRAGHVIAAGVCVLLPALLLVRRRWSVQALQILLYCGTALWVRTALLIARQRMHMGQPWIRMALILSAMAAFTLISGLLLNASNKSNQE